MGGGGVANVFLLLLILGTITTALILILVTKQIPPPAEAPILPPSYFTLTCTDTSPYYTCTQASGPGTNTFGSFADCQNSHASCTSKVQCISSGGFPTETCGPMTTGAIYPIDSSVTTACDQAASTYCSNLVTNLSVECNPQLKACQNVVGGATTGQAGLDACLSSCKQYYYTCNDGTCSGALGTDSGAIACSEFGQDCCKAGTASCAPVTSSWCFVPDNTGGQTGGMCTQQCASGSATFETAAECTNNSCKIGTCNNTTTNEYVCMPSHCSTCTSGEISTPCFDTPLLVTDASYCDQSESPPACKCRYGGNAEWKIVNADNTAGCNTPDCTTCQAQYIGNPKCGSQCTFTAKTYPGGSYTCEQTQNTTGSNIMICPDTTPCTTGLPLLNDPEYPGYDPSLYKCALDIINDVGTPRSCVEASTLSPTDYQNIVRDQYYNDARNDPYSNCSAASPADICSGIVQTTCA